MSGDDISNLWSAINDLRGSMSNFGQVLARVESLLSERCSMRAAAHEDLRAVVKANASAEAQARQRMDERIAALEKSQIKTNLIVGIGSSVVTAVAMGIISALVRGWMG